MPASETQFDVVIVGAGFSGLYMLHKLRGMGVSARVFEAGESVGGTWWWNRYPGARVDIESQEYSYSFSPELEAEWEWSERYAAQPELLRYLNHVADRFDLRRDIELGTRVTSTVWDDAKKRWAVTTDKGQSVTAKFCVMATGLLSVTKQPDFPGLETFKGLVLSTGDWPAGGVDLKGKRVGIIGTGSSAVQTITTIAREVGHLTVFQRTPSYSVPAHNGPQDKQVAADWKANRDKYRRQQRTSQVGIVATDPTGKLATETPADERRAAYEERWRRGGFTIGGAFADILISPAANATIAEFVADKIRGIVTNPATAEKLIPKTYPIGSKRLCVDTGYYEVFNRPNVDLVDVATAPIKEITPTGLKTADGDYAFDVLILAIGFDAMTGALSRIDIRGRDGAKLKDAWAEGPKSYLGLMTAGFPNLFIVTGPGSPSALSNVVVSIEQHVEWIAACIGWLGERQLRAIEASSEAQDAWVAHVNEVANMTLYPQANSWYLGANIPGKPRVFMPYIGGVDLYRQKCEEVASRDYEGFIATP